MGREKNLRPSIPEKCKFSDLIFKCFKKPEERPSFLECVNHFRSLLEFPLKENEEEKANFSINTKKFSDLQQKKKEFSFLNKILNFNEIFISQNFFSVKNIFKFEQNLFILTQNSFLIWDTLENQLKSCFKHKYDLNCFLMFKNNLFLGDQNGSILVLDLKAKKKKSISSKDNSPIISLLKCFVEDLIVSFDSNNKITVWKFSKSSFSKLHCFQLEKKFICACSDQLYQEKIWIGCEGGEIVLYSPKENKSKSIKIKKKL